jgi:S1-C subfamily serine protease
VVKVEARALDGATSASSLGARRSGSGVIIDERLVLTIGYLLLEVESVEVTTASGRKVPGTVAGYDHTSGFGLVRTALPMDGKRIELGDSDRVAERQKVLTVGQGEDEATELLVLSRKPFAGSWEYLLERPIFTFPPVNNWSGAALIAEDGRLVGIGSLIVNDAAGDRQGVPGNLFVPVNLLKPILGDLLANGRRSSPVQPWLGLTTEVVRGHLMVVRVSKSGPADQAGVDPGDIIMGVGGEKVADQADFYRRLWKLGPAGTEVKLRVLKGGDVRELPVKSIDRMEVLAKPTGV